MRHQGTRPGKRVNYGRRKGRAVLGRLLLLLLFIVGACVIIVSLKNIIVSKMVKYGTAQWKVVEQRVPVDAVVIRSEKVIVAPAGGDFEPAVSEGEKVPVGTVIGYIKTQNSTASADLIKIPVKAPEAGLISLYPDGLETVLKPDMLNNLDLEKIPQLLTERQEQGPSGAGIKSGQPLLKLVDNLISPYLFIKYQGALIEPVPARGDILAVEFSQGEKKNARVTDLKINGDEVYLMVQVDGAPDLSLRDRVISLNLIPKSYEGVTVFRQALVQKEGRTGIFLPREGVCTWREVQVKGSVEDQVVVTGMEVGDQYIINPSLVDEGRRID